MLRREVVRASCSVRLCVKRASVVLVIGGEVDVADEAPRSSERASKRVGLRARRVDSVSVCGWGCGWMDGWESRAEMGSGTWIGEGAEAREGDEEGVFAPRRSSPSDESPSSRASSWLPA